MTLPIDLCFGQDAYRTARPGLLNGLFYKIVSIDLWLLSNHGEKFTDVHQMDRQQPGTRHIPSGGEGDGLAVR